MILTLVTFLNDDELSFFIPSIFLYSFSHSVNDEEMIKKKNNLRFALESLVLYLLSFGAIMFFFYPITNIDKGLFYFSKE